MVFVGRGGAIDGVSNPDLRVAPQSLVQINLINGDGATHDIALPDFDAVSEQVRRAGASTTLAFRVGAHGSHVFFCTLPDHRAAGMEGRLIVGEPQAEAAAVSANDIVRSPTDLPGPIGDVSFEASNEMAP